MILSMTSYGERLTKLHERLNWIKYLIDSELWLFLDEDVPEELEKFVFENKDKIKIFKVKNIGSLKKSYYALQKTDNFIFMLDDDWLYTPNWINYTIDNFIANYNIHRDCVIGSIGYKIIKNNTGNFEFMGFDKDQTDFQKSLKYKSGHCRPLEPSIKNVILSGGPGSFIRRSQLHEDFFNLDKYFKLCPTHDEIWNWIQTIRLGYKHMSMNTVRSLPINIEKKFKTKLGNINTNEKSNEYLEKLLNEYPEIRRLLELT